MIQAVTTSAQRAAFSNRIAGKPYFAATMGTHCALFGAHPATGWRFYLLPGTAALALRGGTATLCGQLPEGEAGAEAAEELQGFLQFLGVDRLLSEEGNPAGWQAAPPLYLFTLARRHRLPLPPEPPCGLRLDCHPAMQPVSRLVFPDREDEGDQFYAEACTALAHGLGQCLALLDGETPVCTVGSYACSDEEAYMAAGVTAPAWRGRGLAGWLIPALANRLAVEKNVCFACAPELVPFYTRLGFTRCGEIQQFIREWDKV